MAMSSSRPRLERGGRRITASRQSRPQTLPPPSGGATPNQPIHGRSGQPQAFNADTAAWSRTTARTACRPPAGLPSPVRGGSSGSRSWHQAAGLTSCGSGYLPKSPCQPGLNFGSCLAKSLQIGRYLAGGVPDRHPTYSKVGPLARYFGKALQITKFYLQMREDLIRSGEQLIQRNGHLAPTASDGDPARSVATAPRVPRQGRLAPARSAPSDSFDTHRDLGPGFESWARIQRDGRCDLLVQ